MRGAVYAVSPMFALPLNSAARCLALLAMALWIWAGFEAIEHHHHGDEGDCGTCAVAAQASAPVVLQEPAVTLTVPTWSLAPLAAACRDHSPEETHARGPPQPS